MFPGFVPLVLLEGCLMWDLRQLVPAVSAELCTLDSAGNTSAEQNTDAFSVVIDCSRCHYFIKVAKFSLTLSDGLDNNIT